MSQLPACSLERKFMSRDSYSNSIIPMNDLMEHFAFKMLEGGTLSDFTIYYGEGVFRAHKCILYHTCGYFKHMFDANRSDDSFSTGKKSGNEEIGGWSEQTYCEISPLERTTIDAFHILLIFLYTQKITEETLTNHFFELYYLADYFEVSPLLDIIMHATFEKQKLTLLNAKDFIPLILHYLQKHDTAVIPATATANKPFLSLPETMEKYIVHFMIDHAEELANTQFPFVELSDRIILKIFQNMRYIITNKPTLQAFVARNTYGCTTIASNTTSTSTMTATANNVPRLVQPSTAIHSPVAAAAAPNSTATVRNEANTRRAEQLVAHGTTTRVILPAHQPPPPPVPVSVPPVPPVSLFAAPTTTPRPLSPYPIDRFTGPPAPNFTTMGNQPRSILVRAHQPTTITGPPNPTIPPAFLANTTGANSATNTNTNTNTNNGADASPNPANVTIHPLHQNYSLISNVYAANGANGVGRGGNTNTTTTTNNVLPTPTPGDSPTLARRVIPPMVPDTTPGAPQAPPLRGRTTSPSRRAESPVRNNVVPPTMTHEPRVIRTDHDGTRYHQDTYFDEELSATVELSSGSEEDGDGDDDGWRQVPRVDRGNRRRRTEGMHQENTFFDESLEFTGRDSEEEEEDDDDNNSL